MIVFGVPFTLFFATLLKLDYSVVLSICGGIVGGSVYIVAMIIPRGVTYVNDVTIDNRQLFHRIDIDLKDAQIKVKKFMIVFSIATLSIKIYKTKRSLAWLKQYQELNKVQVF